MPCRKFWSTDLTVLRFINQSSHLRSSSLRVLAPELFSFFEVFWRKFWRYQSRAVIRLHLVHAICQLWVCVQCWQFVDVKILCLFSKRATQILGRCLRLLPFWELIYQIKAIELQSIKVALYLDCDWLSFAFLSWFFHYDLFVFGFGHFKLLLLENWFLLDWLRFVF